MQQQPPFRFPTAEPPRRDVIDSWKFLLPAIPVAIAMLLAHAWGLM